MGSFNKVAIATALLICTAILIWPFINKTEPDPTQINDFFTENLFGDGSETIIPIPQTLNLDARKIALGEKLFIDRRLSSSGFACSSCHYLDGDGTDNLKLSRIAGGGYDVINTPTIFNTGLNSLQLWNGKYDSLDIQLQSVLHNPLHMNTNWDILITTINADQDYKASFKQIYDADISQYNITDVFITFERSLITPNSAFDRYLNGDKSALTKNQKQGFQLFNEYGCISCHQGINIGGNLFAKFGIFKDHLSSKPNLSDYDYGRYQYTQKMEDMFVFRVPSLRNVAVTGPYFHDGRASDLQQAIKIMAQYQLDIELPDQDIKLIAAFLESLTGEYKGRKL